MIPSPTSSGYAWRARHNHQWCTSEEADAFSLKPKRQILKPKVEPGAGVYSASKAITTFKFSEVAQPNSVSGPRLADHWFASKAGRTLSDSAIRLLRLKDRLEICLNDREFESEAFITECRLREEAASIIGYCV